MKKSKTTCRISNPCNKLDSSLDHKAASNYCSSCNKEVLNLLELSEQHILQNMASYKGRCVSVQATKLRAVNRKMNLQKLSKAAILAVAISMLAPSCQRMALANEAHALEKEKNRYGSKIIKTKSLKSEELDTEYYIITGRVVDETGEGLISASIEVIAKDFKTVTDFDGYFTLKVPKDVDIDIEQQLRVSYVGYKPYMGSLIKLLDRDIKVCMGMGNIEIGYLDVSEMLENE